MEILKLFILSLSIINAKESDLRILNKEDMQKTIALVTEELKKSKLSADERYSLFYMLAEDLRSFRYHKEAEDYYSQAINSQASVNKINSHIGLINIAVLQNDKKLILERISQAREYLKSNPKFATKVTSDFIDGIAYGYEAKSENPPKGMLATFAIEEKIHSLIKEKKYSDAFSYYKKDGAQHTDNPLSIITYDLLNFKISGDKSTKLNCQESYKLKPHAYTYSAILCGLLLDKISGNSKSASLKRAETYFKEDSQTYAYLFELYKDIK